MAAYLSTARRRRGVERGMSVTVGRVAPTPRCCRYRRSAPIKAAAAQRLLPRAASTECSDAYLFASMTSQLGPARASAAPLRADPSVSRPSSSRLVAFGPSMKIPRVPKPDSCKLRGPSRRKRPARALPALRSLIVLHSCPLVRLVTANNADIVSPFSPSTSDAKSQGRP